MERLGTIYKLHKIFSMGYLPSRKDETYHMFNPKMRMMYGGMVNCFEHACFNLTNELLYSYDFNDLDTMYFGEKMDCGCIRPKESMLRRAVSFVNSTGLIMRASPITAKLKNNEWLVAYYFGENDTYKDFHFFLQEKDGTWSGKNGFELTTTTLDTLPPSYSLSDNRLTYNLERTFKIENPFVK